MAVALDHPFAWVGIAAAALSWTLASLVYFRRPDRAQNRLLALVLFFEGVAVGAGTGLMYLMTDRGDSYAYQGIAVVATLVVPVLYLAFLTTLNAPLVQPLRSPAAQFALAFSAVAAAALWFLFPARFISGMERVWYAEWDSLSGPWQPFRLWGSIAIYVFGLLVAISAYRAAVPGSTARNRALAYVAAFGTRDVLLITIYILRQLLPTGAGLTTFSILSRPFVTILFVVLVSYGILRTDLFDLDVRVKKTLSRGTVAAAFVAVFFVASEGAQLVFADYLGPVVGVVAAGLLVFVISPLHLLAERLAGAAMPGVRPVRERPHDEREALFRHQLEVAWADGRITSKEAKLLEALRGRLGLSAEEAGRLQSDTVGRGRATGRPTRARG